MIGHFIDWLNWRKIPTPPKPPYVHKDHLTSIDRDIIRMALRRDVDIRRYVPEVMSLCQKLNLPDPPWFQDEEVKERVESNRPQQKEIK